MAQLGTSLNRPEVTTAEIEDGIKDVVNKLQMRLEKKGYGSYASRHEILGIITEEYQELTEAVRDDSTKGYYEYSMECLDMAVAGIFGYICMKYHIKP